MSNKVCFHCQESIPKGVNIQADINGSSEQMCCYGCKAVAEFISEEGHCDFYDYRGDSQPATKARIANKKWLQFDEAVSFNAYTKKLLDNIYVVTIRLEGIYCSACGWLIDKHLRQLEGIIDVKLNTITKLLQVEFKLDEIKLSQILTAINYLGYQPILSQQIDGEKLGSAERKAALKRLVVAGFGMMFIMTLAVPLYSGEYNGIDPTIRRFFSLISLLVATAVYFYSGKTFLQNAFRDLRNKHLGMDVPVAISITLAYGVSAWNVLMHNGHTIYFDSMVMFVFFLLAGRFVEMTVRHQGMSTTDALGSMIPASVKLISKKGSKSVPIESISKGDIIQVSTSEVIAIDGEIIKGKAKIDESMITGESLAVTRTIADKVMAGSRIDSGVIRIKSTAIGDETILASLSNLLEKAQLQKPKTLQLVDKIAAWFVAAVLLLASLTAIYYSIYLPDKTLITVLAVLVATCPCALSLATPAALTAASVRLMKSGILINNLDAINQISKINHWFFDKTGTLTEPYMSVVETHNFSHYSDSKLLKIVAAIEHSNTHPIASAFNDYFDSNIVVKNLQQKTNAGLQVEISENIWRVGTKKWCKEKFKIDKKNKNQNKQENKSIKSNQTLIYLSENHKIVAVFELENKLRKGSVEIMEYLQDSGKYTAIISGDKEKTVASIARILHVSNFLGEKTPEEKINIIKYHQDDGYKTVMLGDGVNDAPVLAQSDISISFNQGTQLARAASDLIIMGNSLNSIKTLIKISQKTNAIIKQNILWALIYNLSVTPLAVMGYLAPWMAAIGMSISSLFVVLNAKRLLLK
jgi:Cu2+-exporting ATPase